MKVTLQALIKIETRDSPAAETDVVAGLNWGKCVDTPDLPVFPVPPFIPVPPMLPAMPVGADIGQLGFDLR